MNIGIFTDCYYPQVNGVISSVMILREELINRGHNVTIITVKVPGHTDSTDDIIRVKSIPFSKWKEFRLGVPFFSHVYKEIKDLNLDLIHTHTEFSIGLLGKYMAKNLNIPIVHTYHTMYEDYSHYLLNVKYAKRFVKKFIIQSSKTYVKKYNAIIAPTDKTKNALMNYGVKNNIFVVPTGISLDKFKCHPKDDPRIINIRKELGLKPDDKIILSLGRISEEKSVDVIINQMKNVKEVIPNAKLVIVGDGPYKETLEKKCKSEYLGDMIIFRGRVPWNEVSYYYSMSDVFVSASKTETQGLTIMEAMASKIPVAVYDDDNVKNVIFDRISGRLFSTEEELTKCLIDILGNTIKSSQIAETGHMIIQSLSKEQFGENAERVYSSLVDESTQFKLSAI